MNYQIIKIVFELNRIYEFNEGIKEFNENKKYSKYCEEFDDYEIKEFNLDLILMILKFRSEIFHEIF